MADRALRGMTIGAKSMESEDGVEFAERMIVSYECPMAHVTRIPMSTEAEVPPTWECPECGQIAARRGEDEPEPDEPKKTPRTHWDMLLERRKVDELEVLLNERLEALRSGEVYRERSAAERLARSASDGMRPTGAAAGSQQQPDGACRGRRAACSRRPWPHRAAGWSAWPLPNGSPGTAPR